MAPTIWIILCILMLNFTGSLAKDQHPVDSLNLGESPVCESQLLPKGISEWHFTEPKPISVRWTYVEEVSLGYLMDSTLVYNIIFQRCNYYIKL